MKAAWHDRDRGLSALVAVLVAMALIWALLALRWRIQHDTPLLFYVAMLMDRFGLMPYRDIFETSFPGTFLLHRGIAAVFGYGDRGLALFNVLYFAALAGVSGLLLRPFGMRVALAAPAMFALIYFGHGQFMTLQRDYLAILPIASALLAVTWRPAVRRLYRRAFALGLGFALAAAIKPQLGLAAIPAFAYLLLRMDAPPQRRVREGARLLAMAALGGAVVVGPIVLWLWWQGALQAFLDMALGYLPLHLQLNGQHTVLTGAARRAYNVESWLALGGYGVFLIPATLGVVLVRRTIHATEPRALLALLLAVALVHGLLPALAGQFWDYHWMPFAWSISGLAVLVLRRREVRPGWMRVGNGLTNGLIGALIAATLWFGAYPGWEIRVQLHGWPLTPPLHGRVDTLTEVLKAELEPGDRVQALDWTGGAVHAMLQAGVPTATRFLYDYHFYHHVETPYIQQLRRQFLAELDAACPRLVIEVHDLRHPKDLSGAPDFPALTAWLQGHYAVRVEGDEYRVWKRRSDSGSC